MGNAGNGATLRAPVSRSPGTLGSAAHTVVDLQMTAGRLYFHCAGGNGEAEKPLKALRLLVRPAGIEPATPAFGGQYSIH